MRITLFVARFKNYYGIGLSAEIAETNLLDEAHGFPEPWIEDDVVYPNLSDRGDCMDFCQEAVNALEERTKFLTEFRESGSMLECPPNITHVWVDEMGTVNWTGNSQPATKLVFSMETSPGWTAATQEK